MSHRAGYVREDTHHAALGRLNAPEEKRQQEDKSKRWLPAGRLPATKEFVRQKKPRLQ